jgi:hypothetical protein
VCIIPLWLKPFPLLKPHELRHGVAMEVYEQHHDLEEVRAPLVHAASRRRTSMEVRIRPPHLKFTVAFYEGRAIRLLSITLTEKKAV